MYGTNVLMLFNSLTNFNIDRLKP